VAPDREGARAQAPTSPVDASIYRAGEPDRGRWTGSPDANPHANTNAGTTTDAAGPRRVTLRWRGGPHSSAGRAAGFPAAYAGVGADLTSHTTIGTPAGHVLRRGRESHLMSSCRRRPRRSRLTPKPGCVAHGRDRQ
jgi:hypothetical protein